MTVKELQDLQQLNELKLTDTEASLMLDIFDRLSEYEHALKNIETGNTEIMVHVMPMANVLREDIRIQNFSRESLLEGAPEHTDDSWQVPRLVK